MATKIGIPIGKRNELFQFFMDLFDAPGDIFSTFGTRFNILLKRNVHIRILSDKCREYPRLLQGAETNKDYIDI